MLPTAAQLFERAPRFLRRHRLMKSWMKLTGEGPLQLVRIRDQAFGYADMSDGFLRLIVIEGEYEADFFRIGDALLERGGVFFDVGANHGLFSIGLGYKFGERVRYHLFEPSPYLRRTIEESLARYPDLQMILNAEAVSDREGSVQIHFLEDQMGMSHVVEGGGVSVQTIKLDIYLERNEIPVVDFMKMDIEGYELVALRGAESALRDHRIKALYFEYCEKWLARYHRPRDLLDYLASLSYAVCYCRSRDVQACGGPTHTIKSGMAGNGIPLRPIGSDQVPMATDLIAIPAESIVPL